MKRAVHFLVLGSPLLLAAAFVGLSCVYQRATPPLEASDEGAHLIMVLHLKDHGRLPVLVNNQSLRLRSQEMAQPPLYYAIAALWIRGLNTDDAPACLVARKGAPNGRADLPGPKHIWAPHPRHIESSGTLAAVRQLRVMSMLLGLITVLTTWACARALRPAKPWFAFAATAWVALNPMVVFVTNSVNNDALLMALAGLTLLCLVRTGRAAPTLWQSAQLGILVGLSVLTKTSGLLLLPVTLLAVLSQRGQAWPPKLRNAALILVAGTALSGWWFARNQVLYGDWSAATLHIQQLAHGRPTPDPWALVGEWDGFVKSYWGVFGAFNVVFANPIYTALFGLTGLALGLAGTAVLRGRTVDARWSRLLALWSALNLLAVAYWTSRLTGSQGRLLFASLPAHGLLWAIGVGDGRIGRGLAIAVAITLFVIALWGGWMVIPAAYAT